RFETPRVLVPLHDLPDKGLAHRDLRRRRRGRFLALAGREQNTRGGESYYEYSCPLKCTHFIWLSSHRDLTQTLIDCLSAFPGNPGGMKVSAYLPVTRRA